jgi:hypothetical protein
MDQYTSPLFTDPNALTGAALPATDPTSGITYDYSSAINQISPGLGTSAVQAASTSGQSWVQTLANLATSLTLANSQRQLLNVQLQRAQQGLPPLDASQVGLGVSVGISSQTQKLVLLGGAALLIVLFLAMRRR